MKDLYALLNIARSAKPAEIEAAIQQRIAQEQQKQDHGDTDAATTLFHLREAKITLLDETRRARYNAQLDQPEPAVPFPQAAQRTIIPPPSRPLAKCQACGGSVAKQAKSCPHCGQPMPSLDPVKRADLSVGIIAFGLLTWWGIHSWIHREPPTLAERIEALAKEAKKNPTTPEKPKKSAEELEAERTEWKTQRETQKQRDQAFEQIHAMDAFMPIMNEWSDAIKLAESSPRIALAPQVQKLMMLRGSANNLPATGCAAYFKQLTIWHMDATIEGFLAFMRRDESMSTKHFNDATDKAREMVKARAQCANKNVTAINSTSN